MKKFFLSIFLAWFISINWFWIISNLNDFSWNNLSSSLWNILIEQVSAKSCSQQTAKEKASWLPCSENWIQTLAKNESNIDSWISKKTLRESIIWVVNYFLILLWILWVVMIIYAWVKMVAWQDEDREWAKKTIFWVIIWFVIIFLSYSIISFVWNIW